MKKLLFILSIFHTVLIAQYDRPGSTDAQFLKIGVSSRGTAMGDAYIAIVKNAEAAYYNSAALPWIQGTDIVVNHNQWFAGINHEFISVAHNLNDYGSFAVSFTGLYTDEMKVRTPLQPEGTGETFYAGNYRFALSYGRFLTDRVTFGATFSFITMSLYSGLNASATSVDIATMYASDFRGFRFAMQISHFGSNVQYVNESYPLPTNFTFGIAMNAIDDETHKVLVSLSAIKPNEGQPQASGGLEYNFDNNFFLRCGYRLNHKVATYSFGGGLATNVNGLNVRFDYSYNDYSLLGAAHRFGIGFGF
jgi:hypothetical protein